MYCLKGLQISWIPAIQIVIFEHMSPAMSFAYDCFHRGLFTRQMRHKEKGKPDFSILSVFLPYLLFYFPAEFSGKTSL